MEFFYDFYHHFKGNIDLFCMDHCSQGLSGRWSKHIDRGWAADFAHYADDAEHFVDEIVLEGRGGGSAKEDIYIIGHSMGGLIASMLVERNPGLFDKVVFSSPMFAVRGIEGVPYPIFRLIAVVGAKLLGKELDFVPGAGPRKDHLVDSVEDGNQCCSCQARLDNWHYVRKEHPLTWLGGVTWGWIHTSNQYRVTSNTITAEQVDAFEKSDILLLQCEKEKIVCNKTMDQFNDTVRTSRKVPIAGSLHEAFFEIDTIRDFTISTVVDFLQAKKTGVFKERKFPKPPTRAQRNFASAVLQLLLLLFCCYFLYRQLMWFAGAL